MPQPPAPKKLTSFIWNNLKAQHLNNQARVRELRRYATSGFAEVFNLVPALLNVNDPQYPGYVSDPTTPFGVKSVERQLWLPREERTESRNLRPVDRPVVDSLFLIGSSGSVGHTVSSDLDYWVCCESGALSGREIELFQRKLAVISQWAAAEYGTEAHFYAVDLTELAQGRWSCSVELEAEGAAAPLLLLEEFYRTSIFVAGRPPLWQGLSPDVTEEQYRELAPQLAGGPDAEFIDLGFPALPTPQQMLTAALLLARKSEDDPFKGILKIVALLDQVESGFTRPALCDEVKRAVLAASPEQLPVDPYVMTIERVVEYGRARLSPEQLELLRTSVVLKVLGSGGEQPDFFLPPNSPKWPILRSWATDWGWDLKRLNHLSNYGLWTERERLRLSRELMNMLSSVYVRIAQYLMSHYPGQVDPQDEELAPLAARLLTRLKGLDATVETLPSQLDQHRLSRDLLLVRDPERPVWLLYLLNRPEAPPSEDDLIYQNPRAARVAAWLTNNRVYGPRTRLVLPLEEGRPEPSPEAMAGLLAELEAHFPPFRLRHEDLADMWSVGGQGAVMLILNLETADPRLRTADIILRTGWGEMRHYFVSVADLPQEPDKYLRIIQTLLKECPECRPQNLVFYAPNTPEMHKNQRNIRGALASARRGRAEITKKRRLDL